MLSLLGSADSATLRSWFAALADGGHVVDDLQERPSGRNQWTSRGPLGLHWLIGFDPTNRSDPWDGVHRTRR